MTADETELASGSVAAPSRAAEAARVAALACTFALIVLGIGGELVWARIGHGTLVIKVLPLAAALPGLSRHHLPTYRWLSLLVWLYAAEGALRLRDAPPAGAIALVELVLSFALFAACAMAVRVRLAAGHRAAGRTR